MIIDQLIIPKLSEGQNLSASQGVTPEHKE